MGQLSQKSTFLLFAAAFLPAAILLGRALGLLFGRLYPVMGYYFSLNYLEEYVYHVLLFTGALLVLLSLFPQYDAPAPVPGVLAGKAALRFVLIVALWAFQYVVGNLSWALRLPLFLNLLAELVSGAGAVAVYLLITLWIVRPLVFPRMSMVTLFRQLSGGVNGLLLYGVVGLQILYHFITDYLYYYNREIPELQGGSLLGYLDFLTDAPTYIVLQREALPWAFFLSLGLLLYRSSLSPVSAPDPSQVRDDEENAGSSL